jgi:hypothetical protein
MEAQSQTQTQTTPEPPKEQRLVDVVVANENVALNLLVSFVNMAHKRGAFGIDESAKIWECIQMFQK